MRTSREIVLPVPQEEAWQFLVDWERQSAWMKDADRAVVQSSQREGPGVLLRVKTRVFGVPALTELLEVRTWDPPRLLEIAHRRFVSGIGSWSLAPHPEGSRFTWSEDVRLPFPRLSEPALLIYRPFLRYLIGRSMQELRRLIIATGPRGLSP
jgi:hypothetical protein